MINNNYIKFFTYSGNYYETFKKIHDINKSELYLYPVKYFLLCRSIELVFKSILLFNNITKSNFRTNKTGHNLIELYNLIKPVSKFKLTNNELIILKTLNSYYSKKEFEYAISSYKELPYLSDIVPIYERLYFILNSFKVNTLSKVNKK